LRIQQKGLLSQNYRTYTTIIIRTSIRESLNSEEGSNLTSLSLFYSSRLHPSAIIKLAPHYFMLAT